MSSPAGPPRRLVGMIDNLLDRLKVRMSRGAGSTARCPAHGDWLAHRIVGRALVHNAKQVTGQHDHLRRLG